MTRKNRQIQPGNKRQGPCSAQGGPGGGGDDLTAPKEQGPGAGVHGTHLSGHLLMASSGKRGTWKLLLLPGWVGTQASVNPGQPNLQEMEELKRWNVSLPQCNTALFRGTRCSANRAPCSQPLSFAHKLFSCDCQPWASLSKASVHPGSAEHTSQPPQLFPQELLSEACSCTVSSPAHPHFPAVWVPWEGSPVSCLCPAPPEPSGSGRSPTGDPRSPPGFPRRLKSNPIISLDLRGTLIPTCRNKLRFHL